MGISMEISSTSGSIITRAERTPEAVAVSLYRAEGPGSPAKCKVEKVTDSGQAIRRGNRLVIPGLVSNSALAVGQTSGVGQGAEPPAPPSVQGHGITQQITFENEQLAQEVCPNAGYIKGVCRHGNSRWVKTSCKRRGCPVCGKHRRNRIAYRIALGVELLGGPAGAGWFVGTFDKDIEKKAAVIVQGKFVRWVRKYAGIHVEYAVTWEDTMRGRLHCNLVFAPWVYIPQKLLSEKWERFGGGRVVWIERVGVGIGVEAAKSRNTLGRYFAKFDQQVQTGRGVSYSQGWPKSDNPAKIERKGLDIVWLYMDGQEVYSRLFECERDMGYWNEVRPGEWGFCLGEDCDCFDLLLPDPGPDYVPKIL